MKIGGLVLAFLLSISSNIQAKSSLGHRGPLSEFRAFQVTVFVSPFSNLNQKEIAGKIRKELARVGEVQLSAPPKEELPLLLVSVSDEGYRLDVVDTVLVERNGFPFSTSILQIPSHPGRGVIPKNALLPEGEIEFSKTEINQYKDASQLLDAFLEKFQADNSDRSVAVFYLNL